MTVYTYTEARQKLAAVLDQAVKEGAVQIRRRDGTTFVIQPERRQGSPLDVGSIQTEVTTEEIVNIIREGRERGYADTSN